MRILPLPFFFPLCILLICVSQSHVCFGISHVLSLTDFYQCHLTWSSGFHISCELVFRSGGLILDYSPFLNGPKRKLQVYFTAGPIIKYKGHLMCSCHNFGDCSGGFRCYQPDWSVVKFPVNFLSSGFSSHYGL